LRQVLHVQQNIEERLSEDPQGDRQSDERQLVAVIEELVRELHPQRVKSLNFSPSSRLEEDLGIDSLARTELILRIERAFHARFPAHTLGEAETIADLVRGLEQSERKQLIRPEAPPPLNMPFVQAATEARTLMDVLEWHVANHPVRLHLSLLQEDLTVLGAMTYGELAGLARRVASGLIQRDVEPGDRVAIMLPTSVDFFTVFFGVLYAGAIPVPIYPPMRGFADRGSSAPSSQHSEQRRRPHSGDHARRPQVGRSFTAARGKSRLY